eukprot:5039426-Prymnesium_polylepis.1
MRLRADHECRGPAPVHVPVLGRAARVRAVQPAAPVAEEARRLVPRVRRSKWQAELGAHAGAQRLQPPRVAAAG